MKRAVLCIPLLLGVQRVCPAVEPEVLERAANELSVGLSSTAASLGLSSRTLHIDESPGEDRSMRLLLIERLLENRSFLLLDGPIGRERSDLGLNLYIHEPSHAFATLVDRKTGQVLAVRRASLGGQERASTELGSPRASPLKHGFLLYAGPALRGSDVGWNVGIALRPAGTRWEAAFEGGRVDHDELAPSPTNTSSYNTGLSAEVRYWRLRGAYLYHIEAIRGPRGRKFMTFPGHCRIGGGMGLFDLRYQQVTRTISLSNQLNDIVYPAEGRKLIIPFLELGLVRRFGTKLEVSLSGEYWLSQERFGYRKFKLGGPGFLLQLVYRLR